VWIAWPKGMKYKLYESMYILHYSHWSPSIYI
jgi:hypothetical protein